MPTPRPPRWRPARGAGRRPLAPVAQPGRASRTRVLAHRRCLRELPDPTSPPAGARQASPPTPLRPTTRSPPPSPPRTRRHRDTEARVPVPELWIVTRTRERYQAITALHAEGHRSRRSRVRLGLDRRTVRRFVRAASQEELQVKNLQRASCSTTTPTTCTGAGPRVAPTPPPWPRRSPRWATAAATGRCAPTCTPCAMDDLSPPAAARRRRPSARSPAGSCATQTISTPTISSASSRSWPTAHSSTPPPLMSPRSPR